LVRIKICGITRQGDAELAIELGADALGFVFEPLSPRFINPDTRFWIGRIAPYAHCVAVYGEKIDDRWSGCNSIQCIELSGVLHLELIPPVFKVVRPRSADPAVVIGELKEWLTRNPGRPIRGIVLDAFVDNAFGGTGARIDWDLAASLTRLSPKPVILAGGLTPDNVAEAIRTVRPYAVDVSSGVEVSPGIKDPVKMRDFIQAAKEAVADSVDA